jgi:hypothetical protein
VKLGAVLILFILLIPLTSWGQDPPYFYLKTNFIDLGEDKSSGKYKIFASSNAIWQVTIEGAAKEALNLSKTAGQGEAEINFSIDRSKAPSGWQDLKLKYSWQADVSGALVAGSDELFIRFYSPPVHPKEEAPIPEAPVQKEEITTPVKEYPVAAEIQPTTVKPQEEEKPELFIVGLIKELIDIFRKIFTVYTLHKECWIKKAPRFTSRVIEFMPAGTKLIILEAKKPWYRVLNENTGAVGWTHESAFRLKKIDVKTEAPPNSGYCEPEAYIATKA